VSSWKRAAREASVWCEERVAACDGSNGVGELGGRCVLEHEATGARRERLEDVFVEVEGRQHEDTGGVLAPRDQSARGLDAVHARHPDIHDHDVGLELSRPGEGLLAVGSLADHLEIVLRVEHRTEAVA
jgi:hypothetical protein